MRLLLVTISVLMLIFSARAEDLSDQGSPVWNNPLEGGYYNLDHSYEAVVQVVECLREYNELDNYSDTSRAVSCANGNFDRAALRGREDLDRSAYQRNISEGPPKEGPYTKIRVVRVGDNKSLIQIFSDEWHIFWGVSSVPELAERRRREIEKALIDKKGRAP